MKKAILFPVVLFLLGSGLALAQDKKSKIAPVVTYAKEETKEIRAGHIYETCKRYFENSFTTRENVARKATCNGYFFAAGGLLITMQLEKISTGTCVPPEASTHDIIKAFIEWGSKEESDLNLPAPKATLMALRAKYPCIN